MKNIKNTIIMFALVLTLGVISCDNGVEPDPTVDGLTFADFNGTWNFESVTYDGITYSDCTDWEYLKNIDENVSTAVWTGLSFVIDGTNNEINSFIDCDGAVTGSVKNVVFDSKDLTMYFFSAGDYKFQIVDYDLTSTPKRASIKLIQKPLPDSYPVLNAIHNVVKE